MATRTRAQRPSRERPRALLCVALIGALALGAGCIETVSLGEGAGEDGSGTTGGPIDPWITPPVSPGDFPIFPIDCHPGLTTDLDGDGFSPQEGDCDDCDPDVGPNAVEMPTALGETSKDDDCDGLVDEEEAPCDAGLVVDEQVALTAARALELCRVSADGRWGVVKAQWVLPDGSPAPASAEYALGHGVLGGFGPNVAPRHGQRLLALSSGAARQPGDPGYVAPDGLLKGYLSKPPPGFPKESAECPGVASGASYDAAALEVMLRVPQNAESLEFDFNFYSYEVPEHVCSTYNDLFVAQLLPAQTGHSDANIAFDRRGAPVSVNSALFEACGCDGGPPCDVHGRELWCPLGDAPLAGTGFGKELSALGDHGATGWLTAASKVTPSSTITLRLSVEDAGDGRFDSTVLLDSFRWRRSPPEVPKSLHPPER